MQRPEMREPVNALTQLSADDKARIAAFERECAVGGWHIIMNATREEGEAMGRAEGKAEGRAEGRAEGKAEGRAEALLAVLEARGLSLSNVQRELILATRELALLDEWLRCALGATATAEIFRPLGAVRRKPASGVASEGVIRRGSARPVQGSPLVDAAIHAFEEQMIAHCTPNLSVKLP